MNFIKSLFTYKGRVGRKEFFMNTLILGIFFVVYLLLLWLYFFKINSNDITIVAGEVIIYIGLMAIPIGILFLLQTIKRTHDLNKKGIFITITFILFIVSFNILAFIKIFEEYFILMILSGNLIPICSFLILMEYLYLLIYKGTAGPNKYGPDPLLNSNQINKPENEIIDL